MEYKTAMDLQRDLIKDFISDYQNGCNQEIFAIVFYNKNYNTSNITKNDIVNGWIETFAGKCRQLFNSGYEDKQIIREQLYAMR